MSSEYESYLKEYDTPLTQVSVDRRAGDRRAFLGRHDKVAKAAIQNGRSGLHEAAFYLHHRIADTRMLRIAWDHLRSAGGHAPGPNGHRYDDYDDAEVWSLLRAIGKSIRRGTYVPGRTRKQPIPKSSGCGTRPLQIADIEDRVVERAIYRTIRPLLDPLFDERSYGSRPCRDRRHALALAEHLTVVEQRHTWVVEDIADAFEHVPRSQLLDIVRHYLPDDELLRLIEIVIDNGRRRGLKQGGPLSPLLMNLYSHHFLDTKWRRRHPEIPLVRIVDDLLVVCRSASEAKQAYQTLQDLVQPAGLPLKHGYEQAAHDLQNDCSVTWVGYQIALRTDELAVHIAESAWERLQEQLALCHLKPQPPIRARRTARGWISQLGPCWPWQDRVDTYSRLATIAADLAFEELPRQQELDEVWRQAHDRWLSIRSPVRAQANTTC